MMNTQSPASERHEVSHIHIVRPSRRQPPPAWLGKPLEAASSTRVADDAVERGCGERAA